MANPASLIGSVAMLLTWLEERRGGALLRAAGLIEAALDRAVAVPEHRPQVWGSAGDAGLHGTGDGGAGRLAV